MRELDRAARIHASDLDVIRKELLKEEADRTKDKPNTSLKISRLSYILDRILARRYNK